MRYGRPNLFVDTCAFLAIASSNDRNREAACQFNRSLQHENARLTTTNFVLCETFTLMRSHLGLEAVKRFHEDLGQTELLSVFTVEPVIESAAWDIFSRYQDKQFGFTDCTSSAVMRALRIKQAFTFDVHFAQFGFESFL